MKEPELTAEMHSAIIDLVRVGNYPETASAVFGVTYEVYCRWMKLAADKIEPYARLKDDFEKFNGEMHQERLKLTGRAS